MFGLTSGLSAIVGGALTAGVMFGGFAAWNAFIDNPGIRKDERAIVQAENAKLTTEAINEIASNADKARAMRRYCASVGMRFDFARIECVQG